MRDVSSKQATLRRARARAVLKASKEAIDLLRANKLPKADPLPVAKVAAVQAAKQTSLLIPYCHPLPIDFVDCKFEIGSTTVTVETEVKAITKTGVEMEALAAVSAAVLTLYDMMKAVDETMEVAAMRLLEKTGGKSDFRRSPGNRPLRCAILVLSDSVSGGNAADTSGATAAKRLTAEGFLVTDVKVLPDDQPVIEHQLGDYADSGAVDLILTTGGTGFGPRDVTPEATQRVIDREAPGVAEALRAAGVRLTPLAMLSRGLAGIRKKTLIVNLPGSEQSVNEGLDLLIPVLPHVFSTMEGSGHREDRSRKRR
jgi:cyclic pyranopterin phosphate synthase